METKAAALKNEQALKDERGQVLVIGLFVILGLAMVSISVANIGMMVAEKIHVQDTADAAAYSAAVTEARYMNLTAYMNRAIVANYNAMAFNTSIWATTDAFDHGLAEITGLIWLFAGVLQFIPIINAAAPAVDEFGAALNAIHDLMHDLNKNIDDWFSQDDDNYNKYIEFYNTDILSMYEGLLYAVTQSARYQIAKEVARKMDKEISTTSVLGLGAETISADELAEAVDFVINKTDYEDNEEQESRGQPFKELNSIFNDIAGKEDDDADHPLLLAAVTEASLDKFASGRHREDGHQDVLRNFNLGNILGEFLGGWKDFIDGAFDAVCYAECAATFGWLDGDCNCDSDVSLVIGAEQRWGQENKKDEKRVPIIARKRMREVNFFGISLDLPGVSDIIGDLDFGHTSGEQHNDIRNIANMLNFVDFDADRFLQCMLAGCSLNQGNVEFSLFLGSWAGSILSGGDSAVDDHWDGAWDDKPVCGLRFYAFQNVGCIGNVISYISDISSDGFEEGVPKFDWDIDLDNVGFMNYHYDNAKGDARAEGNSRQPSGDDAEPNTMIGPSVSVVAVKPHDKVNGIRGLGIGNEDYSVSAISRAQVYYLRSPNRSKEKPSLFNPHWVARLAPIDSEAAPDLLREGLPFVGSVGIPIAPTH